MPCHRYTGGGELAFNSAPLTGLQDWYLAAQLTKFRTGVRGSNANDEDGAKMHLITSDLTDAQIRDVVAHIAWLADKYR
jgi:cytochrome c553